MSATRINGSSARISIERSFIDFSTATFTSLQKSSAAYRCRRNCLSHRPLLDETK
jgi:hypothetical protein